MRLGNLQLGQEPAIFVAEKYRPQPVVAVGRQLKEIPGLALRLSRESLLDLTELDLDAVLALIGTLGALMGVVSGSGMYAISGDD